HRRAAVLERRPAVGQLGAHVVPVAGGVDEREVALLDAERGGDVADEHVVQPVTVQVAEVDAHALERVVPDHLRLRLHLPPTAFDLGVSGVGMPSARENWMCPGLEWLYSSRSGPKSLAMYSSGSWSPSMSVALEPSVQPRETASGSASSTFW